MRYKIVAAVGLAAAAVVPASAAASTPDWLTVASVETGPTPVSELCGEESAGPAVDPACRSVFDSGRTGPEAFDREVPEVSEAPGGMSPVADVDLRNFARWKVCGVSVGSSGGVQDCDNSVSDEREPVGSDSGVSLVNVDATGAFHWSVCGVTVFGHETTTAC
ncbi:hypothetical protein L0U85_11100 [Glycomyces sp. L485]|uniref:hypothetical protein n=1 Tax=Glycomyces sp. L485 TaxID=2909235 RepID=UPI001F4AB0F7|nr:hypothetical protein [Glycomyces sp. L485]MCH7231390.1 hypothetical protein [Glycomyces sp. L485]